MSSSKDEVSRALQGARRYLRGRVRSIREALTYLQRRGVPEPIATRVIAACRGEGLLNDEACACLWADHWANQGYAWAAIREKLSVRGLSSSAIERAASRVGSTVEDDTLRARQRLEAGHPARQGGTPRARLARTLAARGFDHELIERLLSDA